MAKKPMTKSQIVAHFAEKFTLSKKAASAVIEEVAALAVAETKNTDPGVRLEWLSPAVDAIKLLGNDCCNICSHGLSGYR